MNIIARCFDTTALFLIISAGISHKVLIIAGRVKVGYATILIVLCDLSLPCPPWVNINPYLFLLTFLLLLIMRHRGSVLGFKGAG